MTVSPLRGAFGDVGRELDHAWAAEEQRDLELTQAEKWARDPVGWIDAYVWVASKLDDGGETTIRPVKMTLFPSQVETICAWIDLAELERTGKVLFRNIAIEKSRQIGETWLFAAVICWLLHYHPLSGGVMHTDSDEVDDGGERSTIDSIFGKVRFIDRRLSRQHVPGLGSLVFRPFSRERAKIENPAKGSIVRGEGQKDSPFRGLTLDYCVVDEAAFVAHGEKVYGAISEACKRGKALLSTVNGDNNFHARICDAKPSGWRYLRLHWSGHPVYGRGLHVAGDDVGCELCEGTRLRRPWSAQEPHAHRYPGRLASPWYDTAVLDKTDEQVANELDIDRARALGGRVFREFSDDVHVARDGIGYDHALMGKLELGWDFGLDVTSVVVCQDAPSEYRVIGLLEMGDVHRTTATPERVSEALLAYLEGLGVPAQFLTESWRRRIHCIGDPAGQARTLDSGLPFVYAYRRLGWQIGRPRTRHTRRVEISLSSVKRLLIGTPKPLRICGLNAAEMAVHLRNNVWPTDASGARRLGSTQPLDDVHNHACFVAGTMIRTLRGDVAIEDVRAGDLALTRSGWCPVLAQFSSGLRPVFRFALDGGAELVGTGDHPVWSDGEGWRPLRALDYSVSLLRLTGSGTRTSERGAPGHGCTGRFRRAITSTIATVIRSTTLSPTSSASMPTHTLPCTGSGTLQPAEPRARNGAAASKLDSRHGRQPAKDERRSRRPRASRLRPASSKRIRADTVVGLTRATEASAQRSALPPAGLPHAERADSTTRTALASSAQQASESTATAANSPALQRAQLVSLPALAGHREVFNLTVGGGEEYFANGVLVHNCRAFAYLAVAKWPPLLTSFDTPPPPEPEEPHADEVVTAKYGMRHRERDQLESALHPGMSL